MPTDQYTQSIRALSDLGPLRVWSLLVTVFGDLAPDQALDGPTLSMIMAEIGIKPEATRVALHRLRSDDWIASQKRGRTSLHRLTAKGQKDSQAARPRIYGTPEQMGGVARVILTSHPQDLDPARFAQISTRLFVCDASTELPLDAMELAPQDYPTWLGAQIETAPMKNAYKSLHAVLTDITQELDGEAPKHPLHVAVLRVMLVHAWRRLTLKHPDLPRAAHSADWRGHDCRALTTELLQKFPRPDLDQIKAT